MSGSDTKGSDRYSAYPLISQVDEARGAVDGDRAVARVCGRCGDGQSDSRRRLVDDSLGRKKDKGTLAIEHHPADDKLAGRDGGIPWVADILDRHPEGLK
jgi:hypothetical protein